METSWRPRACGITQRQGLLTAESELFNGERHGFGLDADDPHPTKQRAGPYPILLLCAEIPHDRDRIAPSWIVRHSREAKVGDRRPELRTAHERHEWVAAA